MALDEAIAAVCESLAMSIANSTPNQKQSSSPRGLTSRTPTTYPTLTLRDAIEIGLWLVVIVEFATKGH